MRPLCEADSAKQNLTLFFLAIFPRACYNISGKQKRRLLTLRLALQRLWSTDRPGIGFESGAMRGSFLYGKLYWEVFRY